MGWIISAGVHAALILLFFFILAWQAPDPPLPEYGIELNFGLEQAGSGFEQPRVTPSPPTETEVGEPQEQVVEEQEQQIEEEVESEPVEESSTEELIDSQQEDSPVETQPEETEEPSPPVEEEIEEEVQPVTEEEVSEPVEEAPVEQKTVDANALYPGSASQGNKENEAGDAGDPEGSIDSRSLYGTPGGGGGGSSFDLAGWKWDNEPKPIDNSRENGKIVFEIKVDDNGDVFGVRTLQTTVSPSVVKIYRAEVEKLTFSPLSGNTVPAPINVGKVTFIIRSK